MKELGIDLTPVVLAVENQSVIGAAQYYEGRQIRLFEEAIFEEVMRATKPVNGRSQVTSHV